LLLNSLEITDYRNYRALSLDFDPRGAIITGDNGIGKTNLLEAVYYLAFGKSFRTTHDQDLIRFDSPFFRVKGIFTKGEENLSISAAADKNNKIFKINNVSLERLSELFQHFKTVYFSPADLNIVTGSPASRRLFLDQAIAQYDPVYLENLRSFRHILKQRNALLKSNFSKQEKDSWDQQFVQASCLIINQRLDYLRLFIPLLVEQYQQFIQNRETIHISYQYSFQLKQPEFSPAAFAEQLHKNEFQEKLAQRTLTGPHLDDLNFTINGINARSFASQGQARSLVIITRLVQAFLISKKSNDLPLLMFDDVLSDLDQNRATAILKLLQEKYQILIASPFLSHYQHLPLPVIDLQQVL
jgi:DNA replication and repair protein RecF